MRLGGATKALATIHLRLGRKEAPENGTPIFVICLHVPFRDAVVSRPHKCHPFQMMQSLPNILVSQSRMNPQPSALKK